MTTIVYDHKEKLIAIDSRVSQGSMTIDDHYEKFVKTQHGVMFFSGCMCDMERAAEVIGEVKNKRITIGDDFDNFSGVYCDNDGVVYEYYSRENQIIVHELKHSDTYGSGADFALAALDLGMSADQCIAYSSKRDQGTGGKIYAFHFKKQEFIQ